MATAATHFTPNNGIDDDDDVDDTALLMNGDAGDELDVFDDFEAMMNDPNLLSSDGGGGEGGGGGFGLGHGEITALLQHLNDELADLKHHADEAIDASSGSDDDNDDEDGDGAKGIILGDITAPRKGPSIDPTNTIAGTVLDKRRLLFGEGEDRDHMNRIGGGSSSTAASPSKQKQQAEVVAKAISISAPHRSTAPPSAVSSSSSAAVPPTAKRQSLKGMVKRVMLGNRVTGAWSAESLNLLHPQGAQRSVRYILSHYKDADHAYKLGKLLTTMALYCQKHPSAVSELIDADGIDAFILVGEQYGATAESLLGEVAGDGMSPPQPSVMTAAGGEAPMLLSVSSADPSTATAAAGTDGNLAKREGRSDSIPPLGSEPSSPSARRISVATSSVAGAWGGGPRVHPHTTISNAVGTLLIMCSKRRPSAFTAEHLKRLIALQVKRLTVAMEGAVVSAAFAHGKRLQQLGGSCLADGVSAAKRFSLFPPSVFASFDGSAAPKGRSPSVNLEIEGSSPLASRNASVQRNRQQSVMVKGTEGAGLGAMPNGGGQQQRNMSVAFSIANPAPSMDGYYYSQRQFSSQTVFSAIQRHFVRNDWCDTVIFTLSTWCPQYILGREAMHSVADGLERCRRRVDRWRSVYSASLCGGARAEAAAGGGANASPHVSRRPSLTASEAGIGGGAAAVGAGAAAEEGSGASPLTFIADAANALVATPYTQRMRGAACHWGQGLLLVQATRWVSTATAAMLENDEDELADLLFKANDEEGAKVDAPKTSGGDARNPSTPPPPPCIVSIAYILQRSLLQPEVDAAAAAADKREAAAASGDGSSGWAGVLTESPFIGSTVGTSAAKALSAAVAAPYIYESLTAIDHLLDLDEGKTFANLLALQAPRQSPAVAVAAALPVTPVSTLVFSLLAFVHHAVKLFAQEFPAKDTAKLPTSVSKATSILDRFLTVQAAATTMGRPPPSSPPAPGGGGVATAFLAALQPSMTTSLVLHALTAMVTLEGTAIPPFKAPQIQMAAAGDNASRAPSPPSPFSPRRNRAASHFAATTVHTPSDVGGDSKSPASAALGEILQNNNTNTNTYLSTRAARSSSLSPFYTVCTFEPMPPVDALLFSLEHNQHLWYHLSYVLTRIMTHVLLLSSASSFVNSAARDRFRRIICGKIRSVGPLLSKARSLFTPTEDKASRRLVAAFSRNRRSFAVGGGGGDKSSPSTVATVGSSAPSPMFAGAAKGKYLGETLLGLTGTYGMKSISTINGGSDGISPTDESSKAAQVSAQCGMLQDLLMHLSLLLSNWCQLFVSDFILTEKKVLSGEVEAVLVGISATSTLASELMSEAQVATAMASAGGGGGVQRIANLSATLPDAAAMIGMQSVASSTAAGILQRSGGFNSFVRSPQAASMLTMVGTGLVNALLYLGTNSLLAIAKRTCHALMRALRAMNTVTGGTWDVVRGEEAMRETNRSKQPGVGQSASDDPMSVEYHALISGNTSVSRPTSRLSVGDADAKASASRQPSDASGVTQPSSPSSLRSAGNNLLVSAFSLYFTMVNREVTDFLDSQHCQEGEGGRSATGADSAAAAAALQHGADEQHTLNALIGPYVEALDDVDLVMSVFATCPLKSSNKSSAETVTTPTPDGFGQNAFIMTAVGGSVALANVLVSMAAGPLWSLVMREGCAFLKGANEDNNGEDDNGKADDAERVIVETGLPNSDAPPLSNFSPIMSKTNGRGTARPTVAVVKALDVHTLRERGGEGGDTNRIISPQPEGNVTASDAPLEDFDSDIFTLASSRATFTLATSVASPRISLFQTQTERHIHQHSDQQRRSTSRYTETPFFLPLAGLLITLVSSSVKLCDVSQKAAATVEEGNNSQLNSLTTSLVSDGFGQMAHSIALLFSSICAGSTLSSSSPASLSPSPSPSPPSFLPFTVGVKGYLSSVLSHCLKALQYAARFNPSALARTDAADHCCALLKDLVGGGTACTASSRALLSSSSPPPPPPQLHFLSWEDHFVPMLKFMVACLTAHTPLRQKLGRDTVRALGVPVVSVAGANITSSLSSSSSAAIPSLLHTISLLVAFRSQYALPPSAASTAFSLYKERLSAVHDDDTTNTKAGAPSPPNASLSHPSNHHHAEDDHTADHDNDRPASTAHLSRGLLVLSGQPSIEAFSTIGELMALLVVPPNAIGAVEAQGAKGGGAATPTPPSLWSLPKSDQQPFVAAALSVLLTHPLTARARDASLLCPPSTTTNTNKGNSERREDGGAAASTLNKALVVNAFWSMLSEAAGESPEQKQMTLLEEVDKLRASVKQLEAENKKLIADQLLIKKKESDEAAKEDSENKSASKNEDTADKQQQQPEPMTPTTSPLGDKVRGDKEGEGKEKKAGRNASVDSSNSSATFTLADHSDEQVEALKRQITSLTEKLQQQEEEAAAKAKATPPLPITTTTTVTTGTETSDVEVDRGAELPLSLDFLSSLIRPSRQERRDGGADNATAASPPTSQLIIAVERDEAIARASVETHAFEALAMIAVSFGPSLASALQSTAHTTAAQQQKALEAQHESTVKSITDQLNTVEEKLSATLGQVANLTEENKKLEKQVSDQQHENECVKDQLSAAEAKLSAALDQVNQLTDEIKKLEKEIEDMRSNARHQKSDNATGTSSDDDGWDTTEGGDGAGEDVEDQPCAPATTSANRSRRAPELEQGPSVVHHRAQQDEELISMGVELRMAKEEIADLHRRIDAMTLKKAEKEEGEAVNGEDSKGYVNSSGSAADASGGGGADAPSEDSAAWRRLMAYRKKVYSSAELNRFDADLSSSFFDEDTCDRILLYARHHNADGLVHMAGSMMAAHRKMSQLHAKYRSELKESAALVVSKHDRLKALVEEMEGLRRDAYLLAPLEKDHQALVKKYKALEKAHTQLASTLQHIHEASTNGGGGGSASSNVQQTPRAAPQSNANANSKPNTTTTNAAATPIRPLSHHEHQMALQKAGLSADRANTLKPTDSDMARYQDTVYAKRLEVKLKALAQHTERIIRELKAKAAEKTREVVEGVEARQQLRHVTLQFENDRHGFGWAAQIMQRVEKERLRADTQRNKAYANATAIAKDCDAELKKRDAIVEAYRRECDDRLASIEHELTAAKKLIEDEKQSIARYDQLASKLQSRLDSMGAGDDVSGGGGDSKNRGTSSRDEIFLLRQQRNGNLNYRPSAKDSRPSSAVNNAPSQPSYSRPTSAAMHRSRSASHVVVRPLSSTSIGGGGGESQHASVADDRYQRMLLANTPRDEEDVKDYYDEIEADDGSDDGDEGGGGGYIMAPQKKRPSFRVPKPSDHPPTYDPNKDVHLKSFFAWKNINGRSKRNKEGFGDQQKAGRDPNSGVNSAQSVVAIPKAPPPSSTVLTRRATTTTAGGESAMAGTYGGSRASLSASSEAKGDEGVRKRPASADVKKGRQ